MMQMLNFYKNLAIVGGLLVGLIEQLASAYISAKAADILIYSAKAVPVFHQCMIWPSSQGLP